MRNHDIILLCASAALFSSSCQGSNDDANGVVAFAEIAGTPTQSSIILKARVSATDTIIDEDGSVPGLEGYARFEIGADSDFSSSTKTRWLKAEADNGYNVQQVVDGLSAGRRYYWRSIVGRDTSSTFAGATHHFTTLPDPQSRSSLSFVASSCMHHEKFMTGLNRDPDISDNIQNTRASDEDRKLGYPAFETIAALEPLFHILNGDNVYYDPRAGAARTAPEMRNKWHQIFTFPRFKKLAGTTATYWTKDDHDFRYDESDTTNAGGEEPSYELGVSMFREQVPVADPEDPLSRTFGTYRVNELLQIWIVENRDYRSPNAMEDGPDKSIWGSEQKAWLKRTLQESDAVFKLLISPTPMIGPDYGYKIDNHVGGFRHERDAFFEWLTDNGFRDQNFYIINGDRHWQYHAIDPSGYEEFSSGPFMIQNIAPNGPHPGDPTSTDPEGLIEQPYHQKIGGFLHVHLDASQQELTFTFYDEWGGIHYRTTKRAN